MKQKLLFPFTLALLICCIICSLKCCKKSSCDLPAPSSINVEPQEGYSAIVSWSSVPNAKGYKLEVREVLSNNVVLDTFISVPDTSHLVEGLNPDTKYKAIVTPACSETLFSPCSTSIVWMSSLDWIIGEVVVMSPGGTVWQGMSDCDCDDSITSPTTLLNGSSWSIPAGGSSRQIFLANINGTSDAQFKFAYDIYFRKVIADTCDSSITVQRRDQNTLDIYTAGGSRQAYLDFDFTTNTFTFYSDGCGAACQLSFSPCHQVNATDDPVNE